MAHHADAEPWVRSTRCDTGTCLEATIDNDRVVIRSSTDPDGVMISLSRDRWRAFVADLKSRTVVAD
jgi:hypothetical protein